MAKMACLMWPQDSKRMQLELLNYTVIYLVLGRLKSLLDTSNFQFYLVPAALPCHWVRVREAEGRIHTKHHLQISPTALFLLQAVMTTCCVSHFFALVCPSTRSWTKAYTEMNSDGMLKSQHSNWRGCCRLANLSAEHQIFICLVLSRWTLFDTELWGEVYVQNKLKPRHDIHTQRSLVVMIFCPSCLSSTSRAKLLDHITSQGKQQDWHKGAIPDSSTPVRWPTTTTVAVHSCHKLMEKYSHHQHWPAFYWTKEPYPPFLQAVPIILEIRNTDSPN